MSYRKRLCCIFVLYGCMFLMPGAVPAQETPMLRFSVEKLQMSGVIGKDTFAATFHVLTGAQEVKNIKLLASDLTTTDGARIAGSQYQLSPNNFTAISAHSGETVTISLSQVPASGTYKGTIELLYIGRDPAQRVLLPVEVTARSKVVLELAKDASQVNIAVARPLLPWEPRMTKPVSLHIRQTSDAPATIQITQQGPAQSGAGFQPISHDALRPSPATSIELLPNTWQTVTVAVNMAGLQAGHYGATLVFTPKDGSDQQVVVDVKLRDPWLWPLLWLLLGVLSSFAISYWTSIGSARLKALHDIDGLRQRLGAPEGLPADRLVHWQERLDRLAEEAQHQPPATAQPGIDAVKAAIDKDQTTYESIRKQLVDWRTDLGYWRASSDTDVLALMRSPLLTDVSNTIQHLQELLHAGSFDQGEAHGLMDRLNRDMATIRALITALPAVRHSEKENIKNILSQLPDVLVGAQQLHTGNFGSLLTLLRNEGLLQVTPPSVPSYAVSVQVAEEAEESTVRTLSTTSLRTVLRRSVAWIRAPQNYLPLLNALLGLLFLALLLAAGMQALYIGKETFGANRFADYLGLVLWGIGADASRRQLQNLESATAYLRQRLNVNNEGQRTTP